MHQTLVSITQRLSLPAICALCKQYYRGAEAVCHECIALFQRIESACCYCAYPLPDNDFPVCGHCSKEKPVFDQALIAYRYEEPLRGLIHQFKYHQNLYLASLFTRLIQDAVNTNQTLPQCLIPVPLHPKRMKERGFNQAAVLTRQLARRLHIPYKINACQKIKNTSPQVSLDYKQRKANLKHAFRAKPLKMRHVALIDDLLTTGSTANELAKTLKLAGVERVDVWCCARAVLG